MVKGVVDALPCSRTYNVMMSETSCMKVPFMNCRVITFDPYWSSWFDATSSDLELGAVSRTSSSFISLKNDPWVQLTMKSMLVELIRIVLCVAA